MSGAAVMNVAYRYNQTAPIMMCINTPPLLMWQQPLIGVLAVIQAL